MLSLDRPFTYLLEAEIEASTGSLVQVPFHGRAVRGWILGPTDDIPPRVLSVSKAVSRIRFFDPQMLTLFQWMSQRYVAPLATVIGRGVPPRVVSEEDASPAERGDHEPVGTEGQVVSRYRGGEPLIEALSGGTGAFALRPAPDEEAAAACDLVAACLTGGRRAIVIVPEARPLPATARQVIEVFGPRVAPLLGGSKRGRYRLWLDVLSGRYDVVVGTRPTVFAPLPEVGLILVSRESHPAHREDRAPYYHVREAALERARLQGATCVLSAICPSSESSAMGLPVVEPDRRRWPPVEIIRPAPEGRAPRLRRALASAGRGFVFSPVPGAGIAVTCRSCGAPARCGTCGGAIRSEEGRLRCIVCGAAGRCAECGSTALGLRRGGEERVEAWVAGATQTRVHRLGPGDRPRLPRANEILVGGPDDVRELGPGGLDLVAILDADGAERRPGLTARERSVTTWMEAIGWAFPDGRAIVQASRPGDPTIQALVRGKPDRFHADERRRRAEAGFPVGAPVFRVAGTAELETALAGMDPLTLLVSRLGDQTVCLVTISPDGVRTFGAEIRRLAVREIVTRVEAEPHL